MDLPHHLRRPRHIDEAGAATPLVVRSGGKYRMDATWRAEAAAREGMAEGAHLHVRASDPLRCGSKMCIQVLTRDGKSASVIVGYGRGLRGCCLPGGIFASSQGFCFASLEGVSPMVSVRRGWAVVSMLALVGGMLSGCASWRREGVSPEVVDTLKADLARTERRVAALGAELSALKRAPGPAPAASVAGGMLVMDRSNPSDVLAGKEFSYDIKVTNRGPNRLADVGIMEHLPDGFTVIGTEPRAVSVAKGVATWALGTLGARESKVIKVTGMVEKPGTRRHCAVATYREPACVDIAAIQPALKLMKTAPANALLCDPIPYKVVVSNVGTGTAREVRVQEELPPDMKTADGRSSVMMDAGDLEEGQSRSFEFQVKAARTGEFTNTALAMSAGGLRAAAAAKTMVRRPSLALVKSGPELRYVGTSITYELTVTNNGDWVAKDTVLEDPVPANTSFVSATAGGQMRRGKVTWNVGDLEPGASRTMSVNLKAEKIGTAVQRATANAYCAVAAVASAETAIRGISAILLEVIDVEDPIAVGSTETYVIKVTNQGSAAGTNISISCTLEEEMEYVSSTGPTEATARQNVITFRPLPTLGPKEEASWRVTARALGAGDVRFQVTMTSDQLERPVSETEATNLYE